MTQGDMLADERNAAGVHALWAKCAAAERQQASQQPFAWRGMARAAVAAAGSAIATAARAGLGMDGRGMPVPFRAQDIWRGRYDDLAAISVDATSCLRCISAGRRW